MRTKSKRFLRRLDRHMRLERRASRGGGRRRTDREPNRGWIPAAVIALSIAFLDWTVKWLVASRIPLGELVEVWEGRVAFWHIRNDAMILGLYGSFPLGTRKAIAVVAALVGLFLLFEIVSKGHRLPHHRRPWAWLFVGLAFGGMLGNLGERAVHWGVTDYLSFQWGDLWLPPGNVADLALFLSLPVALVVIVFELEARTLRQSEAEEEGRADPTLRASGAGG